MTVTGWARWAQWRAAGGSRDSIYSIYTVSTTCSGLGNHGSCQVSCPGQQSAVRAEVGCYQPSTSAICKYTSIAMSAPLRIISYLWSLFSRYQTSPQTPLLSPCDLTNRNCEQVNWVNGELFFLHVQSRVNIRIL